MSTLVQIDTQSRHPVGERLSIGRASGNDVVLDDRMVSNQHAELVRQPDGSLRVRDLGSRHGTYVGNQKVTDAAVRAGDELLIGPVRLRVEASSDTGADELRKLRAVCELSRAIGVEHDLHRLLDRVLDTCFQLLSADRGMIVTFTPGSRTPCATVARTASGERIEEPLSTSVLSQVMATREPYVRATVDSDRVLQRSESLTAHGVRSLVAVPLLYQQDETEWLGVIHLDSSAATNVFGKRDLELLDAVAGQAALAIKNAMLVRQMQSVRSADWERLDRVVTNLPVGVVVLDDRRTCVLANEWVSRRAGVLGPIVPGAVVEHIAGIATDRLVEGGVREQVTSPDLTLVVESHTGDGRETVVVIGDITRERAQQAKSAHQERLALVGQLAGGIAHDFNNLLTVIMTNAELLDESAPTTTAQEDARTIIQAGKSAADLVRQLLKFSRRDQVKPAIVDVAREVAALDRLLARAVGRDVELTISRCKEPACALIDLSQLEQVVMNLAVNARDAMNGTGRLAIAIDATPEHVTIEVADSGCGMTAEVAARVFEPYFTTKARGKGTGLGLATVHGIVQEANGTIAVRSQPGAGTTFVVTLPRTEAAVEATHTIRVPRMTRGRVLLVDDDEQVRRLTERILRRGGYDVVAVDSAADALTAARGERFDLVLTDIVMPGMSGRELARELDREHPGLRVLLMSGYPGTPLVGLPFIAKPFDRATLLAALDEAASDEMPPRS